MLKKVLGTISNIFSYTYIIKDMKKHLSDGIYVHHLLTSKQIQKPQMWNFNFYSI